MNVCSLYCFWQTLVLVCVCVYVYMYVCLSVCVCMYVCLYVCLSVRVSICTLVGKSRYIWVHVRIFLVSMCACATVYMFICAHVLQCTCSFVCIYICIYLCKSVYFYVCTQIRVTVCALRPTKTHEQGVLLYIWRDSEPGLATLQLRPTRTYSREPSLCQ